MKRFPLILVLAVVPILVICQCGTHATKPTENATESPKLSDYVMPLADGNYWIYEGTCDGSAVRESVGVSILAQDSCEVAYRLTSSIDNPEQSAIVALCNGQIFVNGMPWLPYHPVEYVSRTVPAGTFDSCYEVSSTFRFNGIDGKLYAKDVGLIKSAKIWYSVRSGDSYYCVSSLVRFHIAID